MIGDAVAVVLAAGEGTRLGALTRDRSKAMMPVAGIPMVERVMDSLFEGGLRRFLLVVQPDDRSIRRHLTGVQRYRDRVGWAYQPEARGMADALARAAPHIGGDFVLTACDSLLSVKAVRNILSFWARRPAADAVLTLMEVPDDRLSQSAVVTLERDRVTHIVEKPPAGQAPSQIASLPLYCFSRPFLRFVSPVTPSPRGELELQDAIQALIDSGGDVRGTLVTNRLNLTDPTDYLALNRHFLEEVGRPPRTEGAQVDESARLVPPVLLEPGARVGARAVIGPYVYAETGARIGERARLEEAVLLRGARIPAGRTATGVVVLPDGG